MDKAAFVAGYNSALEDVEKELRKRRMGKMVRDTT